MKTKSFAKHEIDRSWFVVDADDQVLGRMASEIAKILRGKHKPTFQPHVDTGDYVIVINADKIVLTGRKIDQKHYYRYSGHPGGLRAWSARQLLSTYPERIIEHGIKGMLPKNRLGRATGNKLKVYAGSAHPHSSQKPKPLEFDLREVT